MSKLPILMYHNITSDKDKVSGLNVFVEDLEKQFQYLQKKGYQTFHFSELQNRKELPSKSVVITFDDVTQNQFTHALPLLKKYHLKASFFIPFAYVGQTDLWNDGSEKIMSVDELKQLGELIELGHHSFYHKKYAALEPEEIQQDFDACQEFITHSGLQVYGTLAYPFGNYPRESKKNDDFVKILQKNNIHFGLKIGNRVNHFPFKNPYEIMRIDIKGYDSLFKFKLKLRVGKLKLF